MIGKWAWRPTGERLFGIAGGILLGALALIAAMLFGGVVGNGIGRLGWSFLVGFPSRFPEEAGLLPALAGSLFLLVLTASLAFPVGVGAAIYLEEYGRRGPFGRSRLFRIVELNIASLAAVPSIVFGLLGLAIFVRSLGFGPTLLAGACTLALMTLPVVILAVRGALRVVPDAVREAAAALGATRWQTLRHHVLPLAFPNILAGIIRALSRAVGEAAPLILVGAPVYVALLPDGVFSPISAIPVQIFSWVSRPQEGFQENAAAAALILSAVVLLLNGTAVWFGGRHRGRRHSD
jgi:phosphate transport system permease protein